VKLLLAKDGIDLDPKVSYGRTPLSWAAGKGHETVVMLLLAKDGVDPDSNACPPVSRGGENDVDNTQPSAR
jgi:ankyrin repeat protein